MKNNNETKNSKQDQNQQDAKSNTGKNNTIRTSPDAGDEDEIQEPLESSIDEEIEDDSNEMDEEDEFSVNESDLTKEDFEALGPVDLSMDGGEDEQLKQRSHLVDFSADDLDVPGTELDDSTENIGTEDEENNPYSVGGDNHEDLEEDNSRTY